MKKVLLVVTALLFVGTAVFAADIAGDQLALKATVSGSAKLIWGMALDDTSTAETGIQYASGFKNEIDGSVKLTLISKHTVQNSGTGPVYAEIQIADIGMMIEAGYSADTYETILSKISAKLNIGPVYINILGISHSTDMAFFGQKLVSGREDKRGIYNRLDQNDTQNDQKGRYKGLSVGLTDARIVSLEVGVSSAGTWEGSVNTVTNNLLVRAPIVYVVNQLSSSSTKVPLGKVYISVVPSSLTTAAIAAGATSVTITNYTHLAYYFDSSPAAGAYYVLDADEFYSTTATAANTQHLYNIFVALGLGTDISEATGLTLNVKAAMTSYLDATAMAGFAPMQSGIGGNIGYKLSTSGLLKGTSVQVGAGIDWKVTGANGNNSTAAAGWNRPAGTTSGSRDDIIIAGGLRFNLPGNAMAESGSAEYFGVSSREKLNIYPGLALGFQGYTMKHATSTNDWRPAQTAYGASFFDGNLIPVVDVVAMWNTMYDTANAAAYNATLPGIWELGLRLGATVDIFTPYVEYYQWHDNAKNNLQGGTDVTNVAFTSSGFYHDASRYTGGAYTTLKVGVDIKPFKLTTFGITYKSGNLAMTHDMYTVAGANKFWGNLQLSVKIAL